MLKSTSCAGLLHFSFSAKTIIWTTNSARCWSEFWPEKQLKWPIRFSWSQLSNEFKTRWAKSAHFQCSLFNYLLVCGILLTLLNSKRSTQCSLTFLQECDRKTDDLQIIQILTTQCVQNFDLDYCAKAQGNREQEDGQ